MVLDRQLRFSKIFSRRVLLTPLIIMAQICREICELVCQCSPAITEGWTGYEIAAVCVSILGYGMIINILVSWLIDKRDQRKKIENKKKDLVREVSEVYFELCRRPIFHVSQVLFQENLKLERQGSISVKRSLDLTGLLCHEMGKFEELRLMGRESEYESEIIEDQFEFRGYPKQYVKALCNDMTNVTEFFFKMARFIRRYEEPGTGKSTLNHLKSLGISSFISRHVEFFLNYYGRLYKLNEAVGEELILKKVKKAKFKKEESDFFDVMANQIIIVTDYFQTKPGTPPRQFTYDEYYNYYHYPGTSVQINNRSTNVFQKDHPISISLEGESINNQIEMTPLNRYWNC